MTTPGASAETLFSTIVPTGTASAELFGDADTPALFPEEEVMVRHAVEQRRREFAAGRTVARQALQRLGYTPSPIIAGPDREPIWPAGLVGSITHCAGYCAAALARSDSLLGLGIDAEPNQPLPGEVLQMIALNAERTWLERSTDDSVCWDRLLFSAKESVFKAWFPLTHRWLDFSAAHVVFDPSKRAFHATLLDGHISYGSTSIGTLDGRYVVHAGLMLTAVAVPLPR
jgi:4'-phosphopantetheinyl transferase EntD